MIQRWMWYTFVLVLAFLVLTRYQAVNTLLGTGGNVYTRAVGVLQGRTVSGNNVSGIAR